MVQVEDAPEKWHAYVDRQAVCTRASEATHVESGEQGRLFVYDDGNCLMVFDED